MKPISILIKTIVIAIVFAPLAIAGTLVTISVLFPIVDIDNDPSKETNEKEYKTIVHPPGTNSIRLNDRIVDLSIDGHQCWFLTTELRSLNSGIDRQIVLV
jgi:hypothetical protein